MSNPLLQHFSLSPFDLPAYDKIRTEDITPAIDTILADNRAAIQQVTQAATVCWNSLGVAMDELGDRLNSAWSTVSHLNAVTNSDALRKVYEASLQKLSEYSTELGQNQALCAAYQSLAQSDEFAGLDQQRKKSIENALRDFHLSGVDLPDDKKRRYAEISSKLAELNNRFSNNVLDATQGWTKHITDSADLAGVPDSALAGATAAAQQRGLEGYVITLDFPSYYPVMTYGENRALREELYTAYMTRASDQGPNAGKWDNTQLISEILALRFELARLLGFENYAQLSLATKMASSTDEVLTFLHELAKKTLPVAKQEFAELQVFAKEQLGIDELKSWDVGYASEKLRQHRYAISQEELRPYFPAPKVIDGMFQTAQRLFGISIEASDDAPLWHSDATFYVIKRAEQPIAAFYLDPYARANKRGGAWMADCRVRRLRADGSLQLPVAYLTCNFTPPVDGKPALLTHDEVTTLFHEFGHGLHHMLTKMEVMDVSGINGVAWDAVELPSQFMENWCWEPDALSLFARHYETDLPLPTELLDKMLAAKNFQAGMLMMRQLEFALFDFRLHTEYSDTRRLDAQCVLNEVREEVAVLMPPAFTRFAHAFSHIFAGGYAAGYYSYKWAEVLAADAFSLFEEKGIFDAATGKAFLQSVLEQGGSREPMDLFVEFRGREPSVEPLLRHNGIVIHDV
ncbi:MAG: oligopeptidase A [Hahellaceae bacterium]|nr:oligopeptidase A [Hahellaceae bacterium]